MPDTQPFDVVAIGAGSGMMSAGGRIMGNDVVPMSGTHSAAANGIPPGETVVERATRILRGDIRPDDYLTLPPDAAAKVEWEFEMAQQMRPGAVLTEAEKDRIRRDRVLSYHYGWRWVAVLHTPDGVIVLGTFEHLAAIDTLAKEAGRKVGTDFPMPWE